MVVSGRAALAVTRATSTIPIVTAVIGDPVALGLAASLARPGGNVTGLVNVSPDLLSKRLQMAKDIAPRTTRVAVCFDPRPVSDVRAVEVVRTPAASLGVTVLASQAREAADFHQAFALIGNDATSAMLVWDSPMNFQHRRLIVELAAKHRVVGVYANRLFVESGGLVSYAANFDDLFRRAASYVHKILTGARPADLPMEQPTTFELVINSKTAKALGLTIPPSLLAQADQVLE